VWKREGAAYINTPISPPPGRRTEDPHQGAGNGLPPRTYRVALAVNSPNELPEDPTVATKDSERGPMSVSATIQDPPQIPILADGLFVHSTRPTGQMEPFEADVLMPNINCKKCTLQVAQFMAEHAFNNPGGYTYHHCANLQITADSSRPLDKGWPAER
jgi:hypothetical protein